MDESVFARIVDGVTAGEAVRKLIDAEGLSAYAFYKELATNTVRAEQYARAKQSALEAMADDILSIADDGRNDWESDEDGALVVNTDHIQRSRLRVDSRKWLLSKLAPKKYGESSTLELANKAGEQFVVSIANTDAKL